MFIGFFFLLLSDVEFHELPLNEVWPSKIINTFAHADGEQLILGAIDGQNSTVFQIDIKAKTAKRWDLSKFRMTLPRVLPLDDGFVLFETTTSKYTTINAERTVVSRGTLTDFEGFPANTFLSNPQSSGDGQFTFEGLSADRSTSSLLVLNLAGRSFEKRFEISHETGKSFGHVSWGENFLQWSPFTGELKLVSPSGKRLTTYFPGSEPILRDKKRFRFLSKRRPYLTIFSLYFIDEDLALFYWLESREALLSDDERTRAGTVLLRGGDLTFLSETILGCIGEDCLFYDRENYNLWIEKAPWRR